MRNSPHAFLCRAICTAAVLLGLSGITLAQYYTPSGRRDKPQSDALQKKFEELRGVGTRLEASIKTATEQLNQLSEELRLSPEEQEAQMNSIFQSMRDEVFAVLDKLGGNSELMDALARAKEGTIVLKRWFEKQPPDYPNRDTTISELERQIQEFDANADKIAGGREAAQNQLRTVMMQHRVAIQQLKVGRVADALDSVKAVLGELGSLTEVLQDVAETSVPTPVSGVSQ